MSTAAKSPVTLRQTKYCRSLEGILASKGHATNAQLLDALRANYPDVSATTVHRATARLARRGIIAYAPTDHDGSMQYDANVIPHDHFQCSACGMLRDTDIADKISPILEASIDGCKITGPLTINGICRNCMEAKQL